MKWAGNDVDYGSGRNYRPLMRTNVEFRSETMRDPESETPGGEAVARRIAGALPAHGFEVEAVFSEDWGWRIQLANADFPLWIGCGHYAEYPDGLLCFIEPSRPFVRRWLKKIGTAATVEALADAVETILKADESVRALRWWTEDEAARG